MNSAVPHGAGPGSSLRRVLVWLTWLALAGAVMVRVTGGFAVALGALRISSRSVRNPLLLASFFLVATWALAPAGRRGRELRAAWRDVSPPAVAGLAAALLVAIGLLKGAHVVAASDSYGYVSQARMWATGNLRPPARGYDVLPPGVPSEALLPLGYLFTPDRTALVPMYSPGLPMQMALFERLGGSGAVFYVLPLLAGLAVCATYALGSRAGGRVVGAVAAALLAVSPALLFQLVHAPMSDVPAAAWWTVALAALVRPSRSAALLCGVATGLAILTRPNLVLLAVIPAVSLLWSARRVSGARAVAWQRLALFVAGSIPACATVAVMNTYWYGSPLVSGYGSLAGTYYRWVHFWPNVQRYAGRMLDTEGPVAAAAALALIVFGRASAPADGARRVVTTLFIFIVTVWLSYAFYLPFDEWWSLRFLLPAFPALCVVASATIFRGAASLPPRARAAAIGAAVAFALWWSVDSARTHTATESSEDLRFAAIGRALPQAVPPQSVVFAFLHSGSVRYYADRLTMRWDLIEPSRLDAAVAAIQQRGYATFLLIDINEEAAFRARFAGASRLALLNWAPRVSVPGATLYALNQLP